MSLKEWNEAKRNLQEARSHVSKVGKPQRTSNQGRGKWHSIAAKSVIYYQATDGAKNYHECHTFDRALSMAIENNIDFLAAEAIQILESKVGKIGVKARQDVEAMLDEIDAYDAAEASS